MFKAFGFTATMHQESRFMCGFHMSHEELYSMCRGSPNLDTISLKNIFSLSLKRHPGLCFLLHWFNLLGKPFFFYPLHHQQPIYSHPLPVHLSLTRGQVCPCVASSNRKCIMDVTFLSISTTKSHAPLCSE